MTRFRRKSSEAAYTLVDLSGLDEEVRQEIIDDANSGGKTFGVRVVEESVNGPARAALYGVYKDVVDPKDSSRLLCDDETRWNDTKKELGISSTEVDDDTVLPVGGTEDPRREAALREQAAEHARAEAERVRVAEDDELEAVTGTRDNQTHASNIIDEGLDPAGDNIVGRGGVVKEAEEEKPRKNKAPK